MKGHSICVLLFIVATGIPLSTPLSGQVSTTPACRDQRLNLIFQDRLTPFTSEVFAHERTEPLTIPTPIGVKGKATVHIGFVCQLPEAIGVMGWSLAVAVDGFRVTGAPTPRNTCGQDQACHARYFAQPDINLMIFFERTDIVDPDRPANNGQGGVVSALVFRGPEFPPPVGTATILTLELETPDPVLADGATGTVRFQDGLQGAGQPVENSISTSECWEPCVEELCGIEEKALRIDFVPSSVGRFRTADANGDGQIDISDAVYLLNFLFRGGPPPPCREAADTTGDAVLDLSDAIRVLQYKILGGPPPAGSLACHVSERSTPESCPPGATACDR